MSDYPLDKLTEPITKLIETISSGIGALYEPTRIRRKAKADAEAIKVIARAKVEVLALEDSTIKNYYLALEREKLLQEFQKKNNRDNVIIMAAEELDGKTVNEEKVDKDWIVQFVAYAEQTSNEEMQLLWAKLLSEEVQKPNSFSKRAMATLASMSSQEAKAFYEIAICSFKNEKGEVVYPRQNTRFFPSYKKSIEIRNNVKILQTLNLLNDGIGQSLGLLFNDEENLGGVHIPYFDYKIKITWEEKGVKYFMIYGLVFTHIGKELAQLVVPNHDMKDYLNTILTQTVFNHRKANTRPLRLMIEFGKLTDYNHESCKFKKSEIISWKNVTY
ncbi:DUF2806 domain-containing protein [Algibacter sp. L4_22]|uniref:DUF2806 domain-containing protein n=1 Tax=Algibacter sp. L4_22 TaxID=2942477 RepID=UPI00201B7343|nr:DUF2806 domain-containing protein [Algibacter sp. L4_22]MCL5127156.1 DUF2806 domain-containing protein [Algibacter sp. L4_22]